MLEKIREDLRQLIVYSKEFRIAAPRWWEFSSSLTVENMIDMIRSPKAAAQEKPANDETLVKLTAEMGTTLWRLQKRIAAGAENPQEMKRITRDIEALEDAFRQANVEVQDPAGKKYADGMAFKVITRQPMPGISTEMVIETIKPTIYCRDTLIQRGEVIVGVPESETANVKPDMPGTKEV